MPTRFTLSFKEFWDRGHTAASRKGHENERRSSFLVAFRETTTSSCDNMPALSEEPTRGAYADFNLALSMFIP